MMKYKTELPAGLLQPPTCPTQVWEDIGIDFVIGLPQFQGNTVILVVVDRFSKACQLGMLPSNFTAYKTVELFTSIYCRHHGFPRSIITDRDLVFLSNVWRTLSKLHGTTLKMSLGYHSQTEGQTKVVNCCIQQYLRAFVHDKPQTTVNI